MAESSSRSRSVISRVCGERVRTIMDNNDDYTNALALAEAIEGRVEVTLGPTDIELCVKVLRERASLIEVGLAA